MSIADELKSTYIMLCNTFSSEMTEEEYYIILYLLYEHMCDENLSKVMAEFTHQSIWKIQNDIYKVCNMKFEDGSVREMEERLNQHGFGKWKEEM